MPDWQFEHFKTFTPFEIMQQATSALVLYEGENTDGTNPKMSIQLEIKEIVEVFMMIEGY